MGLMDALEWQSVYAVKIGFQRSEQTQIATGKRSHHDGIGRASRATIRIEKIEEVTAEIASRRSSTTTGAIIAEKNIGRGQG